MYGCCVQNFCLNTENPQGIVYFDTELKLDCDRLMGMMVAVCGETNKNSNFPNFMRSMHVR